MITDHIECCEKCPDHKCPDFVWYNLPLKPFQLREQLAEYNQKIPDCVLKWRIRGGETVKDGARHNSALMISYDAGLIVGSLVQQGVKVRDIEIWMEPVE